MNVKVNVSTTFKKQAKKLLKKYISLDNELRQLEQKLKINPELGTLIGHGLYKIRLAVKKQRKGKKRWNESYNLS